jgi:hypothetical protein
MRINDADTISDFTNAVKHYPRILTFIRAEYNRELGNLPIVANNVDVARGRCQVLGELVKLLDSLK